MITEGELQSLLMAILVAGYETTANQLGKFVLCLLERPDQLQILREPAGARWRTRSRSSCASSR